MPKLEYIGEAPLNELSVTSSTRKRCRNDVVGGTNDNGSDIDENHGNIAKRANDSEGKGKGEGKGENNADSSRCGGGIGNGGNSKAKKEKPKKDPNARGVPGTFIFYHYQNDMQPIIRIELPNLTSQEVVSILGKRWQAMTSDEKRSYNDLRNEDKRRHQREIASLRQAAKGVDDDTNARVNRHFDQPECVTVSIIPDKHSPSGGFEKTSPFSHSTISSIHSPANDASANSSSTGKVTTLELESNKENKAGEDDKDLSMFEGLSKRIMAAKSKGGSLAKDASRNIPNHKPTSSTETGSASASEKIVSQLESMKNPVVKLQQFFVEKFTGNNINATEEEDISIASSSSNDSIFGMRTYHVRPKDAFPCFHFWRAPEIVPLIISLYRTVVTRHCRSFQACRGSGPRRTIASCGPSARNRRRISLRRSAGRMALSGPVSSICRIRPTRRICVSSVEEVLLRGSLQMPHRHRRRLHDISCRLRSHRAIKSPPQLRMGAPTSLI